MDTITNQVHPRERVRVVDIGRVVAVLPTHELLDSEEQHDASEDGERQREREPASVLNRFGQKVQEHIAKERTRAKRYEEDKRFSQTFRVNGNRRNPDERDQRYDNDGDECLEPRLKHKSWKSIIDI